MTRWMSREPRLRRHGIYKRIRDDLGDAALQLVMQEVRIEYVQRQKRIDNYEC